MDAKSAVGYPKLIMMICDNPTIPLEITTTGPKFSSAITKHVAKES